MKDLDSELAYGMVGRDWELEQLDTALRHAIEGHGEVVVLTGTAGVGKSALAMEFVKRASARGVPSAWGSAAEWGTSEHSPWAEVAGELIRREHPMSLREGLGESGPWLATILPELADTLGRASVSEVTPAYAQDRVFEGLVRLLGTATQRLPLIIVLDGLDSYDAESARALEFVARALTDLRVLVIATIRDASDTLLGQLTFPALTLTLAAATCPMPLPGGIHDEAAIGDAPARPEILGGDDLGRRFMTELTRLLGPGEPDVETLERAARVVAAEHSWRQGLGVLLDEDDVARLLEVDRDQVAELTANGELIVLIGQSGKARYPAYQFRDGRAAPALARAHRTLVDAGDISPWSAASWARTSHPELESRSPAQWAGEHRDDELLLLVAERDAARSAQ